MKSPNSSYYLRGRGYKTEDLERIVARRSGVDFSDFFKRHIRDVEMLPYEEAFAYVGLRLVKTQAKEPFDAGLSIEFEDPRMAMIENVRNNSPAEDAGLQSERSDRFARGKRSDEGFVVEDAGAFQAGRFSACDGQTRSTNDQDEYRVGPTGAV